ncbi:MAG: DUF6163 family protein [Rhizobiaceae bacterium]
MRYGDIEETTLKPGIAEVSFVWFHRVIGAYCLLFGVTYWIRLIGFYEGDIWRFDLMPVYWQIASVSLAVLFPFAAIGLWTTASWGPVVWFCCAAVEGVMYVGFPDLYGAKPALVISHVMVAAIYCAFRIFIYLHKRKIRR